ncbi:AGAP010954-PA-like protein [Anopheles sinensis]|uniref:AGAP010954-PA-like protein n=1 Tax=Anopheles sinensis TaxID=74873 RepID=A0A084WQC3_ANOSI|nr:AGAP010954-PA-like protein [Anopheles sinensis]
MLHVCYGVLSSGGMYKVCALWGVSNQHPSLENKPKHSLPKRPPCTLGGFISLGRAGDPGIIFSFSSSFSSGGVVAYVRTSFGKNQTNSSRSNTQLIGGGGGVGSGNSNNNLVGATGASSNGGGNSPLLLSQGFSVTMGATNNGFTGSNATMLNPSTQQTLNQHNQQQQLQQQTFGGYQLQKQPVGSASHKQQQQQSHGLGTHNALHRSVSQPATKATYANIMELLKLSGMQSVLNGDMVSAVATASAANGNSSNSSSSSSSSSASSVNSNSGNNGHHHHHHANNTSSSSGHRKLERTQSEPLPQQVNTSRYKTELCRPYEEAGECKYGDKCQFAHGMQELRNLQRHPKYKTELCRTFHSVGFCPPALSMSTGSDRASPIGSLSLSRTTSMTSFFPEASSPTFQQAAVQHAFNFPSSPPASPIDGLSPMATPPPSSPSLTAMKLGGSMVLGGGATVSGLEDRLPVFNRLSSAMDAFTNLAL